MGNRTWGIALLLTGLLGLGRVAEASCRDDTVWLRGDFGSARFSVAVADDNAERAQGLMHVKSMPASRGMLFVYDR